MKKIVALLLAVCMLFGVAACGDGGDTETDGLISLKLWTPISGSDLTTFNVLITKFNQEHKDEIFIDHSASMREDHYKSLKNNIPATGPDMAIIHSQLVQNYAANDYLQPLDSSYVGEGKLNPNDYLKKVVDTLYYEENLYGVPLDVHPIVMYYNKSIVGDNALPTNYTELVALAKKLTSGSVYGMPVSSAWPSEFLYTTGLYQNGGQEITAASDPLFNSESGATAAKVLRDFIHVDKISPNNLLADQDLNMFTTAKAAFHINGAWTLSALKRALGDDLGVISMSNLFAKSENAANNDVMARSHVFCVTKTKKAPSDRKKAAITKFIKWMGENSAQWSQAGQIPAFNAARESEEYKTAEFLSDFGNPNNFRTPAGAVYFESGYETVFQYVTTIMKNNTSDSEILIQLAAAEAEAKRAVISEKE